MHPTTISSAPSHCRVARSTLLFHAGNTNTAVASAEYGHAKVTINLLPPSTPRYPHFKTDKH